MTHTQTWLYLYTPVPHPRALPPLQLAVTAGLRQRGRIVAALGLGRSERSDRHSGAMSYIGLSAEPHHSTVVPGESLKKRKNGEKSK